MSDIQYTPEQQAVIASRGESVLVSAGAGSGKTWVLIKRLMSMVNPPIGGEARADIDDFLVITFTKAAAGELRAKISEAITKAATDEKLQDEKDRIKHLKKQNALVPSAHIGTIHSFCTAILREYGSTVGLRPGFKVIEPEKAEAMRGTVLNRVLEKHYSDPDSLPEFLEIADTFGNGRDDSKLVKTVMSLYEKMQCHARPEIWAAQQKNAFGKSFAELSETVWGREIMDYYRGKAICYAREAEMLADEIVCAEELISRNAAALDATSDAAKQLAACLDYRNGGSWEKTAAFTPDIPSLKALTKAGDQELAEFVKITKKRITEGIKGICDAFPANQEQLGEELEKSGPLMKALLELTLEFGREYRKEKAENSLVDFSDLEHYAAEILTNPDGSPTPVAVNVSRRFKEIMVDEYQDVSPVQDAIFSAVSNEGRNLFFVGDIKQSIYRFRLAEPEIFKSKLDSFRDYKTPGDGPVKIPLKDNFRSREPVVNAVNSVFSKCMTERLGDVDYSDPAQLMVYGSKYPGIAPMPELIFIEAPDRKTNPDAPDGLRFEAKVVADRIKKLVAEKTPVVADKDRATLRPVEYSDFAILLRTVKNVENVFRTVLIEEGIPVDSGAETGYFTSPEVAELMNLLSVADNPHKDVPLISALSFRGFTADELAGIRACAPKKDLYDALCSAAETDSHCAEFLEFLNSLRKAASAMPVTELVWHIICRTDMLSLCSASANGELKRERILKFVELSQKYEDSGYKGLHQFIAWTRRLKERNENPQILTSAERGVTIMSVHKSKGLEFPVVFLCNTSRRFNDQDSRDEVLIHSELGLGPRYIDLERKVAYPTVARSAIKLRLERESRSEEMRLLYVALTRAKEQLYITGTVNSIEEAEKDMRHIRYGGGVDSELLSGKKTTLDWLTAAVTLDGGSNIRITEISYDGYNPEIPQEAQEETELVSAETSAELEKELERNLGFVYPYAGAVNLPSKLTATEIKGMEAEDDETELLVKPEVLKSGGRRLRMPDFSCSAKPVTAAGRGTATHAVLQYIDFSNTGSTEEIDAEIKRITGKGYISPAEAEAIDREALMMLFSSDTGRRLVSARSVRREFRFSLLCDAEKLLKNGGDEQILLQGVVDCLIEEPDGITVIDYKTDRVITDEEIASRTEHYSTQVRAYAMAVERIFAKPVKQSILYYLTPGKAVEV